MALCDTARKFVAAEGPRLITMESEEKPVSAEVDDAKVRITVLSGIEALIDRLGGDAHSLLQRFDIDPMYLDDPDVEIEFASKVRFFEHCADTLGAPFFGFELAERQNLDTLGPIAMVAKTSPTIGEALEIIKVHFSLVTPAIFNWVERCGDQAALCVKIEPERFRHLHQINDQTKGIGIRVLRELTGKEFRPSRLDFPYQRPLADMKQLEQRFGCPVHFGQDRGAIYFPADLLDAPLSTRDSAINKLIKSNLVARAAFHPVTLEESVSDLISDLLPSGRHALSNIASILGRHERSLQKDLRVVGKEYRQILREKRQELARTYLANSDMPIVEVANLLGYADQATFTRAFTQANAISPLRFRKSASGT